MTGIIAGDAKRWHVTKPLIPGQFWIAFNISHDFIILHQEFQISVPR